MVLIPVLALALVATEKPKLAVLDVQAVGASADAAVALGEAISEELSKRGFFDVISSSDIRTLLGVERQKELLGCGDSSCTAELSGAIGARFVLQSTLTRLGDTLQLSVQMLDTAKAQTVARSIRLARDVKALAQTLPWQLAEATATPAPPAPSKILPWTLVGLGAAGAALGAIAAIDGFSRERATRQELSQGPTAIYQTRQTYEEELGHIARSKTLGLIGLAVGGAAIGVGVLLFPKDVTSNRLALLPTGNGAVLVGVLP